MVEIPVYDAEGKSKGKVSFDESVFGEQVKSRTLREVVYAYEANQRQGNANTKNLGDVAGSNKKPWKQKGTGRARTGQKHAPHRRKGSVAHGPHPRSYRVEVPAQMRKLALESALLAKFRDNEVAVFDGLSFDKPRTRKLAKALDTAGLAVGSVLFGLGKPDKNFVLSARNLPRMVVRPVEQFNAYEIMRQRRLVLTKDALEALKGGLRGGETKAAPAKKAEKEAKPAKKTAAKKEAK
ncbi:MAG: 50S ribosomal protein L4 [Planctomycetes bacterium]|nr:50S ribosomal protein L4 [Planctomycetota bacterium]